MTKSPQKVSLLDVLAPPSGQQLRTAVLTTYDLDPDYLERVVLPTLTGVDATGVDRELDSVTRRGCLLELRSRLKRSNVVVLADKRRFDFSMAKSLETYELLFAENYPAFHPKISLLAFDKDFRIVVASANLTEPGYHTNLEVFWMASTERGDQFGQVARDSIEFLSSVARKEWPASHVLKGVLADLQARAPRPRGAARLVHSERTAPILRQWRQEMGKSCIQEIHIVSPFFDQRGQLSPLAEVGEPRVHLYLTERLHNSKPECQLPISRKALSRIQPECHVISNEWMLGTGDESVPGAKNAPEEKSRVLHAKVYATRDGERGWALLGSPNFTERAMLAAGRARNAETAIALSGSWKEIRQLLPPISKTISWRDVIPSPAEEESSAAAWLPFLALAEYDAIEKKLMLIFSARNSTGRWSVAYQGGVLVSGARGRRFPSAHEMSFSLSSQVSLTLREGKHEVNFPIGVTGKEMLPEFLGMDALDYEDILEMLAHGVVSMRQFMERCQERKKAKPAVDSSECRVTHMDKLSQFTKAMENMKKRLSGELMTSAEAKALFDGDLGFNRIIEGVVSDEQLDMALCHLFLLELLGVVSSVRWSGRREAKRVAAKLAARSVRALRCRLTDNEKGFDKCRGALRKIRRLYLSHGAEGWQRP